MTSSDAMNNSYWL